MTTFDVRPPCSPAFSSRIYPFKGGTDDDPVDHASGSESSSGFGDGDRDCGCDGECGDGIVDPDEECDDGNYDDSRRWLRLHDLGHRRR